MSNLRWLNGMSVGVDQLDVDHRRYFDFLREIEIALKDGQDDLAKSLGQKFLDFVDEHGKREEGFLRKIKYPQIDHIIAGQHKMRGEAERLVEHLRASNPGSLEIINEIRKAMVDYLLRGDINFKSYVDDVGARRGCFKDSNGK